MKLNEGTQQCNSQYHCYSKGIPKSIKPPIKKGDTKVVNVDESMLVIKRSDKREVTILTTIHQPGHVGVQRRNRHAPGGHETVQKPAAIAEYNTYMGGVDRAVPISFSPTMGLHTARSSGGGDCSSC